MAPGSPDARPGSSRYDRLASRRAKKTPFSARLLASLPPLVSTTSLGRQRSSAATSPRASSTAARATRVDSSAGLLLQVRSEAYEQQITDGCRP
jgi:hypothetical protein